MAVTACEFQQELSPPVAFGELEKCWLASDPGVQIRSWITAAQNFDELRRCLEGLQGPSHCFCLCEK